MSLLSQLRPAKGSTKYNKRRGRGDASGLGGTAGKGHKGQKARSGGRVTRGFEGGQMPIHRRFPKFGFNNKFRIEFSVVNLENLSKLTGEVTPETLLKAGFIKKTPVKVLGYGKISKALTVKAHGFSETAKSAIEAAGGKVEVLK